MANDGAYHRATARSARFGDLGGALDVRGPGRRRGVPDRPTSASGRSSQAERPPGVPLAAVRTALSPSSPTTTTTTSTTGASAICRQRSPGSSPGASPGSSTTAAAGPVDSTGGRAFRHGLWTLTFLPAQHWWSQFGSHATPPFGAPGCSDSGTRRYYFAGSATTTGSGRSGAGSRRSTSPSSPSAPTSHAGSCARSTPTPRRPPGVPRPRPRGRCAPCTGGCFDLTDEPVDLAYEVLAQVLERARADRERVRTIAVGERWRIPPPEAGRQV